MDFAGLTHYCEERENKALSIYLQKNSYQSSNIPLGLTLRLTQGDILFTTEATDGNAAVVRLPEMASLSLSG